MFKAIEFNVSNIKQDSPFDLSATKACSFEQEKYIFIDSAEKLMNIEHKEIFQHYLTTRCNSNWKIIWR